MISEVQWNHESIGLRREAQSSLTYSSVSAQVRTVTSKVSDGYDVQDCNRHVLFLKINLTDGGWQALGVESA